MQETQGRGCKYIEVAEGGVTAQDNTGLKVGGYKYSEAT